MLGLLRGMDANIRCAPINWWGWEIFLPGFRGHRIRGKSGALIPEHSGRNARSTFDLSSCPPTNIANRKIDNKGPRQLRNWRRQARLGPVAGCNNRGSEAAPRCGRNIDLKMGKVAARVTSPTWHCQFPPPHRRAPHASSLHLTSSGQSPSTSRRRLRQEYRRYEGGESSRQA
jgi:hypothetical protein